MSDYLLADLAEDSIVAVLTSPVRTALGLSASAEVPVLTSKRSAGRAMPLVDVLCLVGDEDVNNSGNFWVDASITVKTGGVRDAGESSAARKDVNQTLLSAVINALFVTDLEDQMTAAASPFHCFGVSQRSGPVRSQDETSGAWLDTISIRFLACAADLA